MVSKRFFKFYNTITISNNKQYDSVDELHCIFKFKVYKNSPNIMTLPIRVIAFLLVSTVLVLTVESFVSVRIVEKPFQQALSLQSTTQIMSAKSSFSSSSKKLSSIQQVNKEKTQQQQLVSYEQGFMKTKNTWHHGLLMLAVQLAIVVTTSSTVVYADGQTESFKFPPIDFSDKDRCILRSSSMGQANAARDKLYDLRQCQLSGVKADGYDLSGVSKYLIF
jgi:hypothetical protein